MRFPPGGSGLRHLAIKRRPPFQAASFVFHLIAGPLGSLRFLPGLLFHDALPSTRLKAWRRADERGVNRLWRITHGGRSLRLQEAPFEASGLSSFKANCGNCRDGAAELFGIFSAIVRLGSGTNGRVIANTEIFPSPRYFPTRKSLPKNFKKNFRALQKRRPY